VSISPVHLSRVRWLPVACAVGATLLGAASAEAQDLGRLFFSVEERALLDDARRDMDLRQIPVQRSTRQPAQPSVTELTFGGSVVRGDGETTTWINGQRVLPGDATREGIRVAPTGDPGGAVRITLPSGVGSIELKPGQKIHVVTGTVVDAYEIPPEERKPSDIELEESPEGEPSAEQQAPANAPTGESVTQPTTGTTAQ